MATAPRSTARWGQYFLDNNLGAQANATYNRSSADREGRPTVNLEDAVPLSANAKLFYESTGSRFGRGLRRTLVQAREHLAFLRPPGPA